MRNDINTIASKRETICYNSIRYLSIAFITAMIIVSMNGLFTNGVRFGALVLVGLLAILGIVILFLRKLFVEKYQVLWIVLVLVGIIIRIAYAITTEAPIISDQLACFNAAQQAAQNDYSWTESSYFSKWAYQIPFVLYEALLLKVFGTVRALYFFNGVFSIITVLEVYLIVKRVYNKRVSLVVTAFFSLFPQYIASISRLYNQSISGVFLLIAVYFFVNYVIKIKEKFDIGIALLYCGLTGLFLGISNLFRSEAIIGLIAVIVWFVYYFVVNVKRKKWHTFLLSILLCIVVTYAIYRIVNSSVDFMIVNLGISQYGIRNGNLFWYIVCGLTPESYGGYSSKYGYILEYKNPDEQYEVFKKIIADIFSSMSLKDVLVFFVKKQYYMWGEVFDIRTSSFENGYSGTMSLIMTYYNHFIYIIVMAFSVIGLQKRKTSNYCSFFMIFFIGFFMAFVIKSIEATYRYTPILVLFLLFAHGIDYFINMHSLSVSFQIKKKAKIQ